MIKPPMMLISSDHDAGDRVPFDEFHRAVHGSIELALFGQAQAQFPRLLLVDDPGR